MTESIMLGGEYAPEAESDQREEHAMSKELESRGRIADEVLRKMEEKKIIALKRERQKRWKVKKEKQQYRRDI